MIQPQHRILFFGTPEFAVSTLRALLVDRRFQVVGVVTQPDREAGRGQDIKSSPVKQLAQEHKIPLFQPQRLKGNETAFFESIAGLGAIDFGVVVAFGQILPQKVLDYPKNGCLNVHASLLPRWRGAAPIQRALLAGDKETGVCIMHMEAGLDTGPVFSTATIPIDEIYTGASLHDALAQVGAKLLVDTIPKISSGELSAQIQPSEGVTYAEKISADDCKINWEQEAAIIARQVRAFFPRPGAFTYLEGKRLKILQAQSKELHPAHSSAQVGDILSVDASAITVRAAIGQLAIEELQLEGRRALSTEAFIKGVDLRGKRLG